MKRPALIAYLLVCSVILHAQKTITGKVTDDKGNPVAGATVAVRGSTAGTSTDSSGNFTLTAPAGAKNLQVTSIGYAAVSVAIGDGRGLAITISADMRGRPFASRRTIVRTT